MKKLFLFLLVVFIGFAINAQELQPQGNSLKLREMVTQTQEGSKAIDYSTLSFSDGHLIKETEPTRAVTTLPWKETFNATTFPPTEWTRTQVAGTENWARSTAAPLWDVAHALRSYTTGATVQNNWLITPAIVMPTSGNLALVFRTYTGDPSFYGTSKVYISTTTNTVPGAFTEVKFLQAGTNEVSASWERVSVDLTPYYNQTIYIAFVYTGADAHSWAIDDVEVKELPDNDLSIAAIYPYTQVPVGQPMLPSLTATVNNIGASAQTNVTVTVKLNGTTIGTSAPITSLASGAQVNIDVPITPGTAIPLGTISLAYTVTQTEPDANPADNTITRTFTGTTTKFANDNNTMAVFWAGTATSRYGNIYTFTKPTTINQIESYLYYNSTTPSQNSSTYSIGIYEVTGPNTVAATAIYTQTGLTKSATATAWATANLTTPQLLPAGSYFICVTGLYSNLLGDANGEGRRGYSSATMAGTALTTLSGAAMLRLNVDFADNDLQIIANGFPYTKIPSFQAGLLPFPATTSAVAKNVGLTAQTNVKTTITYNGISFPVSNTIASLAPAATSAVMTVNTPAGTVFPTALGNNNVVYTVSQDQTDENPDDNTQTYSFEITDGLYAIDGVDNAFVGVGYTTTNYGLGNFFTISKKAIITQVKIGFSASATGVQNYNVLLFKRTGETVTLPPTTLASAYRAAAEGWVTLDVTETELTPGDYFLCIQQTTAANIGVAYDGVPGRMCYGYTLVAALVPQTTFGSLAIRMVLEERSEFTITTDVSPAGTGSVTGGGAYMQGASATLTATANAGYKFSQWHDGVTTNPRTVTVTGDATYTAIFEESDCNDVVIGTGTTTSYLVPINTYYNRSYTQQIYQASDLGSYTEDMEIRSASFKWIHTTSTRYENMTVYMAHTDKNTFASTTDWFPLEDMKIVYQGYIDFSNAQPWSTIPFDTPFKYKGGNIVIAVYNNNGTYWTSNQVTFQTTTYGSSDYYTLYYNTDSQFAPSNTLIGTRAVFRPNVKFEICQIPPVCDDYTVGTGTLTTYNIPVNTFYNHSYTQQIFDANEIGDFVGNSEIHSISFEYIHTTGQIKPNQTIYLANTSKSTFSGTSDWVPFTDLTEVYTGSIDYNDSQPWVTIDLPTPFTWTGGNIVVAVLNNHGTYTTSSSPTFRIHNTPTGVYKMQRYQVDGTTPINPGGSFTGSTLDNIRSNTQFHICGIPAFVDMQAISVTGPSSAVAGETKNYTVTVKNLGEISASNFTVRLLTEGNTQLAQQTVPGPIAPNGTTQVTFPLTFTDPMVGIYKIKGQVEIIRDAVPANNETPLLAVSVIDKCVDLEKITKGTQIGNGTTTSTAYPFAFYYRGGATQTIYTAADLGVPAGTVINGISFKYAATLALTNSPQIKVYLANTTNTNFASTTAWIPVNQFAQVYTGTVNIPTGAGYELQITFDAPFIYTGGNLCVMSEKELNLTLDYTNNVSAQLTSQTPTNRVLYYQSDASPWGSTVTGTLSSNVPNAIFHFAKDLKEFSLNPNNVLEGAAVVTLVPDPIVCGGNGTVTFASSDPCQYVSQVKINNVNITPVPATYTFTNVTAPLPIIEVATAYYQYDIVATHGPNGTIDPGTITLPCGTTQVFQLKPDQGFTIASLTVDGASKPIPISRKYTFANLNDNHTIHVEFVEFPQKYITMIVDGGIGGTIIPVEREDESVTTTGVLSVDSGLIMQQFLFIPDEHYVIEAVYIDGMPNSLATATGSLVLTNIIKDHTIKVIFKKETKNIFASTGPHGMITPSGNVAVPYGENKSFLIKADAGYVIDQLFVDNELIEIEDQLSQLNYIFYEVVDNHTIYATFKGATMQIAVSWTDCGNSTLSPSGDETGIVYVPYNGIQTITFVPDEGCKVIEVLVDGAPFPNAIPIGSYTFTYITENHSIHVTFAKIQYPVKATVNGNGVITPEGIKLVDHGADQKFTWYTFPGYEVVNVFVDGIDNPPAVAAGEYTFTNVKAAHYIDVITAPLVYTITAIAETGGFITPSGNLTVGYGQNQMFTFKPATGYEIDKVLIDGIENAEAAINGAYAFLDVKENHEIIVSFKVSRYYLEAKAGGNGMIEPEGITEITYFDEITYTITPDKGYQISYVLVNGDNKGTINTYTFIETEANGTIEVFFSPEEETGINVYDLGISIYSNANAVYVDNKDLLPITDVSIMDMYGRMVWKGNVYESHNKITLNVATGIYSVRVATEDGNFTTTKVSIQR